MVDGEVVHYLNPAAERLLEVDAARAVGLPPMTVLRDHRLDALLRAGEGVLELETRGRRLCATATAGALVLHDVTEVRRAQEDSRELLAVLSHELRTPGAALLATIEALALDPPRDVRDRFLERGLAEAERLGRLLEDLTVETRPPRERSLTFAEVVQRATAAVQPTLNRRGVRLRTEVPELSAWADEDKLVQVLVNLLENAAVHGPSGGRVALVAWAEDDAVRCEVRDEGEPIDAERVEELYQPHARGGGVRAKGTGLGLYIVRSIVERWGGTAWGRPLGGRGNAFGFSVPATRPRGASGRARRT